MQQPLREGGRAQRLPRLLRAAGGGAQADDGGVRPAQGCGGQLQEESVAPPTRHHLHPTIAPNPAPHLLCLLPFAGFKLLIPLSRLREFALPLKSFVSSVFGQLEFLSTMIDKMEASATALFKEATAQSPTAASYSSNEILLLKGAKIPPAVSNLQLHTCLIHTRTYCLVEYLPLFPSFGCLFSKTFFLFLRVFKLLFLFNLIDDKCTYPAGEICGFSVEVREQLLALCPEVGTLRETVQVLIQPSLPLEPPPLSLHPIIHTLPSPTFLPPVRFPLLQNCFHVQKWPAIACLLHCADVFGKMALKVHTPPPYAPH